MVLAYNFRRRLGLTRGQLTAHFVQSPASQKQQNSSKSALKAKLKAKSAKLTTLRELHSAARPYFPIYFQGFLAEATAKAGEALKSECYIALLPNSLPAAFELKRQFGGRVFCDCVENVEVHRRSASPKWSPIALDLVNCAAYGGMLESDGLITVGNALAKTLNHFGRPVHVLKNFREFLEPERTNDLREMCGVSEDVTLLFASGNVVIGFEPVLEALAQLPDNFHLAGFIKFVPPEYGDLIKRTVKELGLTNRVHLFAFVEYERLAGLAAGADIGLITSDTANPNGAVGLPNRCFDYITAGLPVVAPAMPDVRELINKYGFGRIVDQTTAEHWRTNILFVAKRLSKFREKARMARKNLTWESQEEALFRFLGEPKSVTLIGFRDLTKYQRYKRLSRTLLKRGCSVKAAFFSLDPDYTTLVDGVDYFVTDERHGVVKGLTKIERSSNVSR